MWRFDTFIGVGAVVAAAAYVSATSARRVTTRWPVADDRVDAGCLMLLFVTSSGSGPTAWRCSAST